MDTSHIARRRSWLALGSLVLTNSIPILGVLYWGWDLFELLLLYLGELFILAGFAYVKMARVAKARWNDEIQNLVGLAVCSGLVYFIFICIIFSGLLHIDGPDDTLDLVVLAALGDRLRLAAQVIWWPLVVSILSHLLSYWMNFIGRGEYRRFTTESVGKALGWRMIALHLVVLVGLMLAFEGRNPTTVAILILMGIKTIADLVTHIDEHA